MTLFTNIQRIGQLLGGEVRRKQTKNEPDIPSKGRLRLAALLESAEAAPITRREAHLDQIAWKTPAPPDLHDAALRIVQASFGRELSGYMTSRQLCKDACLNDLIYYLRASSHCLHAMESRNYYRVTGSEFVEFVNDVLAQSEMSFRMKGDNVFPLAETETEALRRLLLANPADMAACEQGDAQIEIVVSSIQSRLTQPGAVLVDYGCGLGRVLQGLSSAPRFKDMIYVAVDEPIPKSVRELAGKVGATARFVQRSKYLAAPDDADVILVVNVLHHIPFVDLASQFTKLLRSLKPGGLLLIHEINELRNPEQRNVPWAFEDIVKFLKLPYLELNPRPTMTRRSRTPLSNVMIEVRSLSDTLHSDLQRSAEAVWRQMKSRTLEAIDSMYKSRDEDRHLDLQHALITNANLDLNRPANA
jgi:SAM-dependent methyltransferase